MNDESSPKPMEEHKGAVARFQEKLWDLIPWAIPALAGALLTAGLTIRDNRHEIDDLRLDVASYEQSMGQIANCVKREECEAVRSLLASHELRIRANEVTISAHDDSAREWKARIVGLEDTVRRLESMHANRVAPEDIKDLEKRVRELERYKDVDDQRMQLFLREK